MLRQLAATIKSTLRVEDVFARYGGEEFAIIARRIGSEDAFTFAERVRKIIAAMEFVHEGTPVTATVSIGVAALSDCAEPSVDKLVRLADCALYAAKAAGRNCSRRAQP